MLVCMCLSELKNQSLCEIFLCAATCVSLCVCVAILFLRTLSCNFLYRELYNAVLRNCSKAGGWHQALQVQVTRSHPDKQSSGALRRSVMNHLLELLINVCLSLDYML